MSGARRIILGDLALVLLLRLLGLLGLLRLLLVVGMEDAGRSNNWALVVGLGPGRLCETLLELLLLMRSHGVPQGSVLGLHHHQAGGAAAIASVGVNAGSNEEGELGNEDDPNKGGVGDTNGVERTDAGGRGVDAVVVFFVVVRAVFAVVGGGIGDEGGP